MGHANRSWLYHAVGLDTQSRCLRLPSGRRWESNTDTHCVAECYSYSYSYCYAYSNSDTYSRAEDYTDAEAASYAAAATIARS